MPPFSGSWQSLPGPALLNALWSQTLDSVCQAAPCQARHHPERRSLSSLLAKAMAPKRAAAARGAALCSGNRGFPPPCPTSAWEPQSWKEKCVTPFVSQACSLLTPRLQDSLPSLALSLSPHFTPYLFINCSEDLSQGSSCWPGKGFALKPADGCVWKEKELPIGATVPSLKVDPRPREVTDEPGGGAWMGYQTQFRTAVPCGSQAVLSKDPQFHIRGAPRQPEGLVTAGAVEARSGVRGSARAGSAGTSCRTGSHWEDSFR